MAETSPPSTGATAPASELALLVDLLWQVRRICAYEALGYAETAKHALPAEARRSHDAAAEHLLLVASGATRTAVDPVTDVVQGPLGRSWTRSAGVDLGITRGQVAAVLGLDVGESDGPWVPLAHVSAMLDELFDVRQVILHAAWTTWNSTTWRTFPVGRRKVTEAAYERLMKVLRWDIPGAYGDRPDRWLKVAMIEASGQDRVFTDEVLAARDIRQ